MRDEEAEAHASAAKSEADGRNLSGAGLGAESRTAAVGLPKPEALRLMEAVVERSNLFRAYERVVKNEGAPGVDGLPVSEFKPWLQRHWARVRQDLLTGVYQPEAVRKVEIPKPQGGVRTLGIPTVLDRLIQQALNQVLQPLFDPEFSLSSYGFRPGRNAHQAVQAARGYVAAGKRWVVDLDLEKFFDRVNHDVLMARVARKVGDERVLKLIRRYLEAGLMEGGITSTRTEGTPQGGPLSPLLSNILLDDLDRELERRRLSFCRYADDCNIYVGSRRAGERVMQAVTAFLEQRLKLKVNASQERGGSPVGAKVPWLQHDVAQETEAEDRRSKSQASGGESPQDDAGGSWPKSATSHRAAQSHTAGLDRVLPAHRSQRCAGRPRWLDQAQAAERSVAAVEARLCKGKESDAGGDRRGAGVALSYQRAWPVVERRRVPHECRLSKVLVRPYGVGFVAGSSATPYICFMNRRMPNGTSCGVGGRRE